MGVGVAGVLAIGFSLVGMYTQGFWTPARGDLVLAGLGIPWALTCFIFPRYALFRKDRDRFCRTWRRPESRALANSGIILWLFVGRFVLHWGLGEQAELCYFLGAPMALVLGYPHYRAMWRHMWLLYERERASG